MVAEDIKGAGINPGDRACGNGNGSADGNDVRPAGAGKDATGGG